MEEERPNEMEMAKKENEKGKEKEKAEINIKSEKLERYFSITEQAIKEAGMNLSKARGVCINLNELAEEFLDVAKNYFDDAKHFKRKGDDVTAFAALNYAHGWLDAGVKLGLFKVKNSKLFAYIN